PAEPRERAFATCTHIRRLRPNLLVVTLVTHYTCATSGMAARKDLGTLLAEEKVISSADLERARKLHRERGGRLLDHLLQLSLITEDDAFMLLANRAGIAAIADDRLSGVHVPLELRRAVPRTLAEETLIVPLELSSDGRTLSVAASDPTDEA